jgi:hypothetical protein
LEEIRDGLTAVLHSAEAIDHGIYAGPPEGYLVSTSLNVVSASVNVTVWAALDPDTAQEWLDALYGHHAVELRTVLIRVDS